MTKTSTAVYNKIIFVLQFHVRWYSWIPSGANVRAFKFLSSTSLAFIFPSQASKKKCAKEYSKEVKKRYQEKFTEILKSILSSSLICLWLKNSFFFLPGEKRNYSCINERKTVWKNVMITTHSSNAREVLIQNSWE